MQGVNQRGDQRQQHQHIMPIFSCREQVGRCSSTCRREVHLSCTRQADSPIYPHPKPTPPHPTPPALSHTSFMRTVTRTPTHVHAPGRPPHPFTHTTPYTDTDTRTVTHTRKARVSPGDSPTLTLTLTHALSRTRQANPLFITHALTPLHPNP